jgi:hypothetical protein
MNPSPKPTAKPKTKVCGNPSCKKRYTPRPGAPWFEDWCNFECGVVIARIKQTKELKRQRLEREKQERAQKLQWKREASQSRANYRRGRARSGPEYQAERAVNAYILIRDANKPCIVHGWQCPNAIGGFHAGHFRPVGTHPELRYVTWNIHKQCAASNTGNQNRSRWSASTDQMYEANLVARIGQAKVEWLKGPHKPLQPKAEYLERVKRIFNKRTKHLKKLRGYE